MIDDAPEWSELATLPDAVQAFAAQAVTVIAPPLEQTTAPPPVYPVEQVMTSPLTIAPVECVEKATDVAMHVFAVQAVTVLNNPFAPQVATPPPEYPALQATVTVPPVTPMIDVAPEWSELATLPVATHEFAVQAVTVITPSLAQTTAPPTALPPVYPVEQVMVSPVLIGSPAVCVEPATDVAEHVYGVQVDAPASLCVPAAQAVHVKVLKNPSVLQVATPPPE